MEGERDQVMTVLKDYVEKVVPNIHRSWLKVGAHTVSYGYPEQSLFWHTVNASMLACKLMDYFQSQGYQDVVDLRELIAAVTLHDLDRISEGKFGRKISLQQVHDAFVKFGIGDFCKTLTPEMAQTLINNTHLFKHTHSFKEFLGKERFQTLLLLTGLLDALAVIQTPREVWKTKGEQERAVYELLKTAITAGKFEFLYHQADFISGATTNALHHAIAEVLSEEIPGLGQLAFFPNGVVYIAPGGSLEKLGNTLANPGARHEFLDRAVRKFYRKFAGVVETTGQFVASEKGQPTPSPFAYFFDPTLLLDSIKSHIQRQTGIQKSRRKEIGELQNKTRSKREERRLKRLRKWEDDRIKNLRDKQLPQLMQQNQDFFKDRVLGEVDYGDLKILSDFVSYLVRMGEHYELGDVFREVLSKFVGVDTKDIGKVGVTPPGGVNYQAITLAGCYLGDAGSKVDIKTEGLGLLEQQRLKKETLQDGGVEGFVQRACQDLTTLFQGLDPLEIQVRRRCKLLEEEMLSEDEKTGKVLKELRALWDAQLKLNHAAKLDSLFDSSALQAKAKTALAASSISSDGRKFWQRVQKWARSLSSLPLEEKERLEGDLKQPIEDPLLDELRRFIGEHLDVNGIRFPPGESVDVENTCNFCGRGCDGIRISEKMTMVDTPTTYYSGYNVLTSTDANPRRLCSLCFFEGVLRKVLYPTQGKGLCVFVFPEYFFTPYHVRIFAKQILEAFPEAMEDQTKEEKDKRPTPPESELLKAIQFKLRSAPKDFAEDVLLPVFVAPTGGGDDLKTWIDKLHSLLQLWDGIGLKYILTSNFYPEAENIRDVKGVIELKGAHPCVQSRVKDWVSSVRQQPVLGLPEMTLTLEEAALVTQLADAVETLAMKNKDKEIRFYTDRQHFAAAKLYARGKHAKAKGE